MGITRRNFITKLTVSLAGLPLVRGLSWAQAKGKLGYMKIVDNAAMFVAMEKGFFKTEGLELETVPMAGGRSADRLDERDLTLSGARRGLRF